MRMPKFLKRVATAICALALAVGIAGCGGSGEKEQFINIATGGTATACSRLIKHFGAEVAGYAFLLELCFFKPREIIANQDGDVEVFTLVQVDGE